MKKLLSKLEEIQNIDTNLEIENNIPIKAEVQNQPARENIVDKIKKFTDNPHKYQKAIDFLVAGIALVILMFIISMGSGSVSNKIVEPKLYSSLITCNYLPIDIYDFPEQYVTSGPEAMQKGHCSISYWAENILGEKIKSKTSVIYTVFVFDTIDEANKEYDQLTEFIREAFADNITVASVMGVDIAKDYVGLSFDEEMHATLDFGRLIRKNNLVILIIMQNIDSQMTLESRNQELEYYSQLAVEKIKQ